jgi:hypothetical protein
MRTNREWPAHHGAAGRLVERYRSSVSVFYARRNPKATIRLTLLNFPSQLTTQDDQLFATILFVTIPQLIMFIIFNRKIVEGMAARPSQKAELGNQPPVSSSAKGRHASVVRCHDLARSGFQWRTVVAA